MLEAQTQSLVTGLYLKRFLNSSQNATSVQQQVLSDILAANADTWFGLKHGFAAIKSIQDYQKAVPICSYQDISELIERCTSGEPNVLIAEAIRYFQASSGSMIGQEKLIPSTRTHQRKIWKALLAAQGFLYQSPSIQKAQRGKGLMLMSTLPVGVTRGGIPCGLASAYATQLAHHFWSWISVASFEVTKVGDPEARRYLCWRYALHAGKLAYVSAPYMPSLLNAARLLWKKSDELIRDVADGTLSNRLLIPAAQRKKLEKTMRSDRRRAMVLEKIAVEHGGLTPRNIWPELGWIYTVFSPSFQVYESQLAECYGHKFTWGMPYIACEGMIGIPCKADSYIHVPALASSFLEFIPEEEWSSANPSTCLLADLEQGKRYDVVLTGWNGLYRYRLNDIVEVNGMFNSVPTIKVISRRTSVLSILWEKITEAQVVAAVVSCASECGASFVDFVVDIDRSVIPARYHLWAEPLGTDINPDVLQLAFDKHLRCVNSGYNWLRNDGEIGSPIAKILPRGTFEAFHRRREQEGVPPEQFKILHTMAGWRYGSVLQQEALSTGSGY